MRHTVKLRDIIVGYSELEEADPSVGRLWGAFRPGLGWELVQPVFRLFVEAVPMRGAEPLDEGKLARYYAARDKLSLRLYSHEDVIIPATAIHIADYPGQLELDVLVSDEAYWASR